jgi:fluoride exporter
MASATMIAAVAAGGAIGALLRYGVSLSAGAGLFGIAGLLATLLVNIAGSGLMGCLAGAVAAGMVLPEAWRGFFAIGLLGALTTFSSFALDAGHLWQKQGMVMAGARLWHQCYCRFWHLARVFGRLGIVEYGNE